MPDVLQTQGGWYMAPAPRRFMLTLSAEVPERCQSCKCQRLLTQKQAGAAQCLAMLVRMSDAEHLEEGSA